MLQTWESFRESDKNKISHIVSQIMKKSIINWKAILKCVVEEAEPIEIYVENLAGNIYFNINIKNSNMTTR